MKQKHCVTLKNSFWTQEILIFYVTLLAITTENFTKPTIIVSLFSGWFQHRSSTLWKNVEVLGSNVRHVLILPLIDYSSSWFICFLCFNGAMILSRN